MRQLIYDFRPWRTLEGTGRSGSDEGYDARGIEGLSQDWGSGDDRHRWVWIVGWLELLSEAGTERAIIDSAANLEQQIGTASRPAHLL